MNTAQLNSTQGTAQLSLFPASNTSTQESNQLNTVYQYFFVINLPPTLSQSIKQLKLRLNKLIGLSDYNVFATPNITLMSFHTMRPVNQNFITAVQQLLDRNSNFEIQIDGFAHFEHGNVSNTLYAHVHKTDSLNQLYHDLHQLLGLKVRTFIPHLTIARTIPRHKFDKIASLFKNRSIKDQFNCYQISVLQRTIEYGTASKFSVLKEFDLKHTLKLAA